MGAAIGDVVELVGPDDAAGFGLGQLPGERPGVTHVVARVLVGNGGNQAQVRPAQPQHVLLLLALGLGHDDDAAIAERVAHQGKADAGVAGGALHDHAAGAQDVPLLGVADDEKRGPVLDRPAGIQELRLAENLAARFLAGPGQADEGRVADRLGEAVANVHDVGGERPVPSWRCVRRLAMPPEGIKTRFAEPGLA
jgi:hypothetical protein